MSLESQPLHAVLDALGEQLAATGSSARLVVVGGSGLLGIGVGNRATEDVDVVALQRDGALVSAEPLPAEVRAAATLVARDFALGERWLNAGPASLLDEATGLPDGFQERLHWRTYGPSLAVGYASRLDQVHLKLTALADRGYPRDRADLIRLEPTAEELRVAAEWVRSHFMPGPLQDQLGEALAEFGVERGDRSA